MVHRRVHRRSRTAVRRAREGESSKTILVALSANLVIAGAKLVAGLVSHSTAMLAESAHSLADSTNEVFLWIGARRDQIPADEQHPFGHGSERFLWAFMAAISSFLIGGCLSVAMGIAELQHRHAISSGLSAWIVLGVAFAAEGISWLRSMKQARHQATEYQLHWWQYLQDTSDPVVRTVVFEDSAALLGIVIAAVGLYLSHVLGNNIPDGIASLAIGVILAITAFALAHPLADFLVGRSLSARMLHTLETMFREEAAIDKVLSVRAMYIGPEEVMVLAKVHPVESLSIEELTRSMDDLDERIRRQLPVVADIFIDVTTPHSAESVAS
jgi:cation diffusion facilitator family transporter